MLGGKSMTMKSSILVLTIIFIIPYIGAAQIDDALVIYLPFDDGSGKVAKDVTQYGNDGQFEGNSDIKWVDGKFDGGIELDGQNYVDIPWADSMDVADRNFSVEIWFKYTEKAEAGSLVWGYNVQAGNPQFWIRTEPGSNMIRGLIHDKTSTSIIIQTKTPHNDGNWHHLAFVRDAKGQDNLTVYIDSKVEDSQKGKIDSVTEGQKYGIHLGQRVDGVNIYKGFLDEFRLWTRALSENEIKANMTKGKDQIMAVYPTGRLTTTWGKIRR